MMSQPACPVCKGPCAPLATVDFNKSCVEEGATAFAAAGIPIDYVLCEQCGFCFAPQMCGWTAEQFRDKVYNDAYIDVDPDYIESRPKENAAVLQSMFGVNRGAIRHLDYGGGSGLLSCTLRQASWDSSSYDPFVNLDVKPGELGQFNLITAFEVFEHAPDTDALMADLRGLLAPGGIILFSTLVSDGQIHQGQPLSWWYAAPRNGHISLYSRKSLAILARNGGLQMASFSPVLHLFFTTLPPWARQLVAPAAAPASKPRVLTGLLTRWVTRLLSGKR